MMVVKVKFYGSMRHLLKEEEVTLSLGDGTLGGVIHELANHLGVGVREELLDEEGNLDYAYSIFINGERRSNLDAKVEEGDEVVITSMLAGGWGGGTYGKCNLSLLKTERHFGLGPWLTL